MYVSHMCIYLAFMELSTDTLTNLQSCPHLLWWLLLQSPRNVGPHGLLQQKIHGELQSTDSLGLLSTKLPLTCMKFTEVSLTLLINHSSIQFLSWINHFELLLAFACSHNMSFS